MWDFVIVGGGSAGAAFARLSEKRRTSVLVLEAGPDWRSAEAPAAIQRRAVPRPRHGDRPPR